MSKKLPTESAPLNEPEWLFPYEYMLVGESFFIPTMRPAYMGYIIDTTSKKAGVKIKAFTRREDGVLGVRAWRVG
jgi:hypothetical protein